MSISFFKDEALDELFENIEVNLDQYRNGDFDDLVTDDSVHKFAELSINQEFLISIHGGQDDDVDNCLKMFEAMQGLTPKLARDKRLWSYLTHTSLLQYTKERWPIPNDDDEAVNWIKHHFFITGSRDFERDNAASRLWWSTFICKRVSNIDPKKALQALFFKMDPRSQVLDRKTTALSTNLFEAVLEKMIISFEGDQKFLTDRHGLNRPFMSEVNALGGFNLLNALSLEQSRKKLKEIDQTIKFNDLPNETPLDDIDDLEPEASGHQNSPPEKTTIKTDMSLRQKLVKFDLEEIRPKHPNTDENERVLSRYMLFTFDDERPRNMNEFLEVFSWEDRDGISPEESIYVSQICKIIDDHLSL